MNFLKDFYLKNQHVILYGTTLAILIFILKWLQWKFLIIDNSIDIYIGLIAILFTGLGIWMANQLAKPKIETVFVEKEIFVESISQSALNTEELRKFNFSTREYEVLQLLAKGNSNAEIGEKLFLSLSTVKTHVSNVFVKMNVKSRTQAIEKAKRLNIIQ